MFFRLGVGRGTANPLWRGLDMANYPRAGHAGGGSHCAGKNATTASYSHRCSVYPAGRRWTCDDARRCSGNITAD